MEKKTTAPTTTEEITEIKLPESTSEFQKLIPAFITEICQLKNRVSLQAFSFIEKQLKSFTDRFNSDLMDFEVNLRDAMDNLMSVYVILEELYFDQHSKFITGKEADNEN